MTTAFLIVWLAWLFTLLLWLATRTRLLDERRFNDRLLRQIGAQGYGTHPTSRAVQEPQHDG